MGTVPLRDLWTSAAVMRQPLGERWETSANGLLGCFFYTLAR